MVIAFLMKENKWKMEQSFELVKKQRPIICPNYGFVNQLKKFEVTLGLTTQEELLEKALKIPEFNMDDFN
jgi:hypothetical protein